MFRVLRLFSKAKSIFSKKFLLQNNCSHESHCGFFQIKMKYRRNKSNSKSTFLTKELMYVLT